MLLIWLPVSTEYENFYSEDWYLEQEGYFKNFTHKDKIKSACNFFKKQANPGTKLSYHSSDTYILGIGAQSVL